MERSNLPKGNNGITIVGYVDFFCASEAVWLFFAGRHATPRAGVKNQCTFCRDRIRECRQISWKSSELSNGEWDRGPRTNTRLTKIKGIKSSAVSLTNDRGCTFETIPLMPVTMKTLNGLFPFARPKKASLWPCG